MADIIQFGDLLVKKSWTRKQEKQALCPHKSLQYSTKDRVIECTDCDALIDPFNAFVSMAANYDMAYKHLNNQKEKLKDATERNLHLIAARKACDAWASRTMVPTCPHCREPIFPSDGFGTASTNRKMALARKAANKVNNDE